MLINFDQEIDEKINDQVVALTSSINETAIDFIEFVIPAYASITIGFNSSHISFDLLKDKIQALAANLNPERAPSRMWLIPVCYQSKFALDMEEVMMQTHLSQSQIIEQHSAVSYRIFMMGFIPGFGYMGKLPDSLKCSRKSVPRKKVPPLAVGIAGQQTGIYPLEAPGGWQIIGKTPVPVFDTRIEDPFLFRPGDNISFTPVDLQEYVRWLEMIDDGIIYREKLHG